MASAVASDRSLRVSNCALAGVASAQAMPAPMSPYTNLDILESSLVMTTAWLLAVSGREPTPFHHACTAVVAVLILLPDIGGDGSGSRPRCAICQQPAARRWVMTGPPFGAWRHCR